LISAHQLILLGGILGLCGILAGLASARFSAPLLLLFLVIGMLAGEEGPGAVAFDDFEAAYLIGSVALAIILFEGGLKTDRRMLKVGLWPALALATAGVGITAGIVGLAGVWALSLPLTFALLAGAVLAPTDAAAIATLVRQADLGLPERTDAVLEVESGLNDPMSVFLTIVLTQLLVTPADFGAVDALVLFAQEMVGGAALGAGGGFLILQALRRLPPDTGLHAPLALMAALALFGLAQTLGASGFLAVYIAGAAAGEVGRPVARAVERFFEAFGWLAQLVLFLLLGLLVTPSAMLPLVPGTLLIAAVLILVARPAACAVCLLPFGCSWREAAFISWAGLRGAVPIYLTLIPVLKGVPEAQILFAATFAIVLVSLVVQGWTIGPAARLLGIGGKPEAPAG